MADDETSALPEAMIETLARAFAEEEAELTGVETFWVEARHRETAATVLTAALAGRAVLDLPGAAGVEKNGDTWWDYPGGGKVWSYVEGRFDPQLVVRYRGMAMALLAAADHNERLYRASASSGDGESGE